MAKNKSEKSPYPSLKGGGFIDGAQYLTELLCINMASQQGVDLPDKFWRLGKWSGLFKTQVLAARSLLKIYSFEVIVKTLKDKRCRTVYSFRSSRLDQVAKEYKHLDNVQQTELNVVDSESKPRTPPSQKESLRSRLQ